MHFCCVSTINRTLKTKQSCLSRIRCVILAHTHTFSPKGVEELKEKDFPIQLFPHSVRKRSADWRGGVITDGTYTGNMDEETSQDPINKHFGTFCGVKHKTCFVWEPELSQRFFIQAEGIFKR